MKIRRVVTGKNAQGKSVVISDGASPREVVMVHTPGFVSSPLWLLNEAPDLTKRGDSDPMAAGGSLLAPVGGAVFMVLTFPPDAVFFSPGFDPAQSGAEHVASSPGIVDRFEMDNPGMHTTPTVDFVTVVKGEVVLELDDGKTVTLRQGDSVVQQGARHAWRNPSSEPVTLSVTMIGAKEA